MKKCAACKRNRKYLCHFWSDYFKEGPLSICDDCKDLVKRLLESSK